jgi:hypothetical protein
MVDGKREGNWNIRDLLGDLMGATAEVKPEARAEIWASDQGKPYVDRWLQMKGLPYSNPPTGKDMVTFFLGKQIELGIEQMLTRCGIAFKTQDRLTVLAKDCLPVVGRPDIVIEVTNWQEVVAAVDEHLGGEVTRHADVQQQALKGLLAMWQKRCPEGLLPTVFEVKSLNSAAFKVHRSQDGLSNAYPHHRLQLYTYMRSLQMAEGHLVYVARDTGWIEEVVVRPTEELEQAWLHDVETMSRYYRDEQRPPLEPLKVEGKDNWRVNYSRYKDYLYQEVAHGAFSF